MTYSATVSRQMKKRRKQAANAHDLAAKAIRGKNKWRLTRCIATAEEPAYDKNKDQFIYEFKLYFNKDGQSKNIDKEWSKLVFDLEEAAVAKQWGESPWKVSNIDPTPIAIEDTLVASGGSPADLNDARTQFGLPDKILTLPEVRERILPQIDKMLTDEAELQNTFGGIFDREPQIRTVLSSVRSFLATDGQRRNHVLLYGLPACAKTQILLKLCEFIGPGAFVKIDATNTTQAGIAKLFFDTLDPDEMPPFVIIEEIEKSHEDILRIWLGALDDRGEIRKMNFNQNRVKQVRILGLATANDKQIFDKLMGGGQGRPGALSSRFVNQLYCNRPDEKVMEMILNRDIHKFGGSTDWIPAALKLAKQINTNDPRKVLAFLDGGDRLISGEYQEDVLKVMDKETEEMHSDPSHVNVDDLNNIINEQMQAKPE